MVARILILMVLFSSTVFGQTNIVNVYPTNWSESWTLYDDDSFYIPTKQDLYELCYAIRERVTASYYASYSYYDDASLLTTNVDLKYQFDSYDYMDTKPWMLNYSSSYLPETFGYVTNASGEWVDTNKYLAVSAEYYGGVDELWADITKIAMELVPLYLPPASVTGYDDTSLMSYMNSSGITNLIVPNVTRTIGADGIYEFTRPNLLPVWNHATLFEYLGLDYWKVIGSTNAVDRRIIAALDTSAEAHDEPLVVWSPTYNGTNWVYAQTYPPVGITWEGMTNFNLETRFRDTASIFRVRYGGSTSNSYPSMDVTLSYMYLNTNSLNPATYNRQNVVVELSDDFVYGSDYPHLYSSAGCLWEWESKTETVTLPWESTNAYIFAITNASFSQTNAAGLPPIIAGYEDAQFYGYSLDPTTNNVSYSFGLLYYMSPRDRYYAGDRWPTWREMRQVKALIGQMQRVPCSIIPYEHSQIHAGGLGNEFVASTNYSAGAITCGDMTITNFLPFLNIPWPFFWETSYSTETTNTDVISYYYPKQYIYNSGYGPYADHQSIQIGNIYRRQSVTEYCWTNGITNQLNISVVGKYSEIDGFYVDSDLLHEPEKATNITVFWTDPYSIGSSSEGPLTNQTYHDFYYPAFRDSSMTNMGANLSVSEYVYSQSYTPVFTNIGDPPYYPEYSETNVLACIGAITNVSPNVKEYIETHLRWAEDDDGGMYSETWIPGDLVSHDTFWCDNGPLGKPVCVGFVGYIDFDFDLK